MKEGRLRMDIKKNTFTVRMVRHCNRLCREVVGALSLEVFKVKSHGVLDGVFTESQNSKGWKEALWVI